MINDIDQIKLDNRIILITGAGDGIGKAVALDCARRGATVILLGKTIHKLEQVYDEIVAAGGAKPAIYPMDLSGASANDYEDLHDNIEKEFGRLDALLNNAGWLGASTPMSIFDTELWYRIMQVNLNAPFLLCKACIPLIKKSVQENSTNGAIVFTADPKTSAYWGAYGVAKSGQQTLMTILADELESQHIMVNAFNPGPVRTNFRTRAYPAEDAREMNKPADISAPFVYLLNGFCDGVVGKTFTLDDFK
ncbi:MAG: SDR family NAD(P)-dependent oxidoreductase [Gammaproteobacteria bacterium]|nr:SDR family NAD(P)-dependent oxidoreductase [Gammaproteobacteria bacterium]